MLDNLLDIHMLALPSDFRSVAMSCLLVNNAIIRVLPGMLGKIGLARKIGYSLGDAPFVSFADPDDFYDSSAFGRLAQALQNNPQCSFGFTREVRNGRITNAGEWSVERQLRQCSFVHGVIVFRRELLQDSLSDRCKFKHELSIRCLEMLEYGPPVVLDQVGRIWNDHPGQTTKRNSPDDYAYYQACREKLRKRVLQKWGSFSALKAVVV